MLCRVLSSPSCHLVITVVVNCCEIVFVCAIYNFTTALVVYMLSLPPPLKVMGGYVFADVGM